MKFRIFHVPMERYIPAAQTRPKPPRVWLFFMLAGYKRAVLGRTILSIGKWHFGPTDRNEQTDIWDHLQSWSQIFRSDQTSVPFDFQPKYPVLWAQWKASNVNRCCFSLTKSQYFTALPLVSSWNAVWETSAEISYWWPVTNQFWVVLLIGGPAWQICFN